MAKKSETEQVLELLTYGVYVITAGQLGAEEAYLTPWLSQVSKTPPMLGFSVAKEEHLAELPCPGTPVVVNLLRAGQKTLAEYFLRSRGQAGDDPDATFSAAGNGCPYLDRALAILECTCTGTVDACDRVLLLCQIDSARMLAEGQPLTLRQTGLEP